MLEKARNITTRFINRFKYWPVGSREYDHFSDAQRRRLAELTKKLFRGETIYFGDPPPPEPNQLSGLKEQDPQP